MQFGQLVALEIDRLETRQADKVLHLLDHVVLQVDLLDLFLSLEKRNMRQITTHQANEIGSYLAHAWTSIHDEDAGDLR